MERQLTITQARRAFWWPIPETATSVQVATRKTPTGGTALVVKIMKGESILAVRELLGKRRKLEKKPMPQNMGGDIYREGYWRTWGIWPEDLMTTQEQRDRLEQNLYWTEQAHP